MMAGKFILPLKVELIADSPPRWRLLAPLAYEAENGDVTGIPADFETDFASVPRLPLAFLLAGDTCHRPAVLHDYLYAPPSVVTRARADELLREAAAAVGVPAWRRGLVWIGVRLGGAGRWQQRAPA